MEVIIKASRQGCPDSGHLLEVRDPGAHHPLQSPKVLQQLPPLGRSQTRYNFEYRFIVAPRALAPVAGDGESVSLVADALHET